MAKPKKALPSVTPLVQNLKDKFDAIIEDAEKFDRGVNAAGTRVRTGLQAIKGSIKEIRDVVAQTKTERKEKK